MEEKDLINIAMQIILNAGDGRNHAFYAINAIQEGNDELAEKEIELAKNAINEAHIAQTNIIQKEMSGEDIDINILFIHAQDTIMTINSEVLFAEQLIQVYKEINALKS